MKRVTWYFDFISPYAYLQSARLDELASKVEVDCVPILFAGLLNHWGQKGPAEVEPKRIFSFRQCVWRARRDAIPFHMPPHHPFNPLRALRLSIALGNDLNIVQSIFHSIWVIGHLPDDAKGWAGIQAMLGIVDGDARVADPAVKTALLENGEAALAANVFGVPTCQIDGEKFWGDDCLNMVGDYITDPNLLEDEDMKKIESTKPSTERR